MPYIDTSGGSSTAGSWYIYGYRFDLDASKTVAQITLPNAPNLNILAMDLTPPTSVITVAPDTQNVVLATFSDPAGYDPSRTYSASVDWGDGTVSSATVLLLSYSTSSTHDPQFEVTGQHTYSAPGSATITITVTPEDGPASDVNDAVVIEPGATWTGSASTSWNDPANWLTGAVPAQGDTVFISAPRPTSPSSRAPSRWRAW